jgi:peptidoglycan hydrolase CwlO-like protein
MDIISLSKSVGAIVTIISALAMTYKFIRNIEKKIDAIDNNINELKKDIKDNSQQIKKIDKLTEGLDYNTIETLRLVIINEDMPLDERLKAGRIYIDKYHGNGSIKLLIQDLEREEYEELHDKISRH